MLIYCNNVKFYKFCCRTDIVEVIAIIETVCEECNKGRFMYNER